MTLPAQPFVAVEGDIPEAVERAEAELAAAGWLLVDGCEDARPGVICTARVDTPDAAQRAVLAAVAGAGLLLTATAGREVLDRLYDDLRRLGPLDLRFDSPAPEPSLHPEESSLLQLLLAGFSLSEAAGRLHLSRRTADRRLASARRALGATTTSEALVQASARGLRP